MKKPAPPTLDPSLLAVLHRCGRAWHVVLANRADSKPSIKAVKDFPLDQADRIDRWLIEQSVGNVLCVLPAGAVICRTVPLPDAPTEQLEPALRLQAEAHLLGIAPPHRVAMAVLPGSVGEATRAGLVLAWPEAADFTAPVTSQPVRYVSDIAALAALLNGQRPPEPLLWLDRGDGSVAIAVTHSGGATFRGTHEEADIGEAWQKSVGRIVAETGLGVGHTGAFIENMVQDARARAASVSAKDAALFLPAEVRKSAASRVNGTTDDAKWWNDNGIAVGAVIAATGPLAVLVGMLHTPPVQRPSRIRNALEAMSRPRAAATVVAACILLLMFAPLLFSGLRLIALKVRYGDVGKQLTIARASRDQVAVYKELDRQKTWPMTKLLSDIATNAPLGIELDIMRVDAGKDFTVSGTAISNSGKSPAELVAQMSSNLRADGVFNDIAMSIGDANNLGVYKFDITGKAPRPFLSPSYPPERDFFAWSNPDRRDGKPMPKAGAPKAAAQPEGSTLASAGNTKPTVTPGDGASGGTGRVDASERPAPTDAGLKPITPAITPDAASNPAVADAGDASGSGSGTGTRRPAGGGAGDDPTQNPDGPASSAGQIPPPITEEQIKAMSEAELRAELAVRSKARQWAGKKDPVVDERLHKEFTLILEQLRKVGGSR